MQKCSTEKGVKIVTIVQWLRPGTLAELTYSIQDDLNYGITKVTGEQSNEAPVCALIQKYQKAGKRIEQLICLCSTEVYHDKYFVASEAKDDGGEIMKTARKDPAGDVTAYSYYIHKISHNSAIQASFMDSEGKLEKDKFCCILYDQNEPEKCIQNLLALIHPQDEVAIDVTSGQRTLQMHLTLSMEAMIHQGTRILDVVFAYMAPGRPQDNAIIPQTHINHLVELNTGVNDFMKHGNAIKLTECLKDEPDEIRDLANAMKQFSEKLLICQIKDIEKDVDKIHQKIAAAKSMDASTLGKLDTRGHVFVELLDAMKENFVQETERGEEGYRKTLNLIKWCIEHDMIQQALSLYRERVGNILVESKLIVPPEILEENYKLRMNARKLDSHESMGEFTLKSIRRLKDGESAIHTMIEMKGPWTEKSSSEQELSSTSDQQDELKNFTFETLIEKENDLLSAKSKPLGDVVSALVEMVRSNEDKEKIAEQVREIENKTKNQKFTSVYQNPDNQKDSGKTLHPNAAYVELFGYQINMSQENLQDCICLAYYLQFVRNCVAHAGVFDCKLAGEEDNSFIELNRNQVRLPAKEVEGEEGLSFANIREALGTAVIILEESLDDAKRQGAQGYYMQRKTEREQKAKGWGTRLDALIKERREAEKKEREKEDAYERFNQNHPRGSVFSWSVPFEVRTNKPEFISIEGQQCKLFDRNKRYSFLRNKDIIFLEVGNTKTDKSNNKTVEVYPVLPIETK